MMAQGRVGGGLVTVLYCSQSRRDNWGRWRDPFVEAGAGHLEANTPIFNHRMRNEARERFRSWKRDVRIIAEYLRPKLYLPSKAHVVSLVKQPFALNLTLRGLHPLYCSERPLLAAITAPA